MHWQSPATVCAIWRTILMVGCVLVWVSKQCLAQTYASERCQARSPCCHPVVHPQVLTHGFVLDERGNKMSKSVGNVVDPRMVINGGKDAKKDPPYGADVLRLWVASVDYSTDVMVRLSGCNMRVEPTWLDHNPRMRSNMTKSQHASCGEVIAGCSAPGVGQQAYLA